MSDPSAALTMPVPEAPPTAVKQQEANVFQLESVYLSLSWRLNKGAFGVFFSVILLFMSSFLFSGFQTT